jgi:hypothetical protein
MTNDVVLCSGCRICLPINTALTCTAKYTAKYKETKTKNHASFEERAFVSISRGLSYTLKFPAKREMQKAEIGAMDFNAIL